MWEVGSRKEGFDLRERGRKQTEYYYIREDFRGRSIKCLNTQIITAASTTTMKSLSLSPPPSPPLSSSSLLFTFVIHCTHTHTQTYTNADVSMKFNASHSDSLNTVLTTDWVNAYTYICIYFIHVYIRRSGSWALSQQGEEKNNNK